MTEPHICTNHDVKSWEIWSFASSAEKGKNYGRKGQQRCTNINLLLVAFLRETSLRVSSSSSRSTDDDEAKENSPE